MCICVYIYVYVCVSYNPLVNVFLIYNLDKCYSFFKKIKASNPALATCYIKTRLKQTFIWQITTFLEETDKVRIIPTK